MSKRPTVKWLDAETGFTYILDGTLALCSVCGSEACICEWHGIGDVICSNKLCINNSTYTSDKGYGTHFSGKYKIKKRDAIASWNAHNKEGD